MCPLLQAYTVFACAQAYYTCMHICLPVQSDEPSRRHWSIHKRLALWPPPSTVGVIKTFTCAIRSTAILRKRTARTLPVLRRKQIGGY